MHKYSIHNKDNVDDRPKSDPKSDPKYDFAQMVKNYLASNPMVRVDNKSGEMEVRFGTNTRVAKPLSKIDYDNVVQQLYAAGFTTANPDGLHILRIYNEFTNQQTGYTSMSNIRAEMVGLDLIQEYCRTNSIQKIMDLASSLSAKGDKVKFTQKSQPGQKDEKHPPMRNVEFPDFNFRVAYQMEQDYTVRSNIAKNIINKWNDSKKTFRYINRVRFSHPIYPIFADISIVKGSKITQRKQPIPQYTIQEADVFANAEAYEVELEIDNSRVGPGTPFSSHVPLLADIRKCIRIVLGGIQGTNYPIAYSERDTVLQSYMKMVHGQDYQIRRIFSKDFIGPSSYTLQIKNIMTESADSNIPNIRRNYTVTDKADGERRLLYVSENGRIYMIDSNMNILFTGTICVDQTLHQSLVDGEFIKLDKRGNIINLYAAFDLYYVNGKSVRELGFIPQSEADEIKNFRLPLLNRLISKLRPRSIMETRSETGEKGQEKHLVKESGMPSETDKSCDFHIKCKEFYSTSADTTIFEGCSRILTNVKDGLFEYNTDGLIFTPSNTAVCSNRVGEAGPLYKTTWEQSFKWKPPQFNTIDFLVSLKKDKTGKDEVHNIFNEGTTLGGLQEVQQYKILILRCGFDERKHGYINPCLDIINDRLPVAGEIDNEETYKPVPFQPTNPYDKTACYSNQLLQMEGNGNLIMKTEENEYFEEDMIVEFRYDLTKSGAWRWIPLRVRYDKTSELRAGMKNYGNAYHVANSNWTSIHNPITDAMISTGESIPDFLSTEDGDIYHRRVNQSSTRSLRDFHNLFVKRKLILGVSQRNDTMIDYAVGKAGDLQKWIHANLSFVFGIDISKDSIQNNLDGACARYITARKQYKQMPAALFVNGNSGANIRRGDAFVTEKDREIARAVFGEGPKDRNLLGLGVYKQYGIGQEGFQISSLQFALHYFFENKTVFHRFIQNVAECTKVGGYFIGTCYDGETVFRLLRNKNEGESVAFMEDGYKLCEITKRYAQSGFPDDDAGLGYAIDVYQETFNRSFREYLVNYPFLVRIMEDYGFVPLAKENARRMGLPNNTGLFDELYSYMQNEIRQNPDREVDYKSAMNMSYNERQISFMNRYFIFQKVRNVNTEKMGKILELKKVEVDEDEPNEELKGKDKPLKKGRKLKVPKIILEKYEPTETESLDPPFVVHSPDFPPPIPLAPALELDTGSKNESESKPEISTNKTYIIKAKRPNAEANTTRKNTNT